MAVLTGFYDAVNAFYTDFLAAQDGENFRLVEQMRKTHEQLNAYLEQFIILGRDQRYTDALVFYTNITTLLNVTDADTLAVDETELETFFRDGVTLRKISKQFTTGNITGGMAVLLLHTPPTGKYYFILTANLLLRYGGTPFTTSGGEVFIVGQTAIPNNQKVLYKSVTSLLEVTDNATMGCSAGSVGTPATELDQAIYMQIYGGGATLGNSYIEATVFYTVEDLP